MERSLRLETLQSWFVSGLVYTVGWCGVIMMETYSNAKVICLTPHILICLTPAASGSQKNHFNYYIILLPIIACILDWGLRNSEWHKWKRLFFYQCPQERLPLFLCWEHLLPGLQSLVKLYWRVSWWLRGPCEGDCWRDPSLHEISHDDPGQCSKASRTLHGEGGFQDLVLLQVFLGRHFCGILNKFRHRGLRAASQLVGGFQRIPEAASNQNPFKKRLETICKIVEANCKFQIAPESRVLAFLTGRDLPGAWRKSWVWSFLGASSTFLAACRCEIFGDEYQGEGVFGHSACPSSSD